MRKICVYQQTARQFAEVALLAILIVISVLSYIFFLNVVGTVADCARAARVRAAGPHKVLAHRFPAASATGAFR